jgi:hypothetical protein
MTIIMWAGWGTAPEVFGTGGRLDWTLACPLAPPHAVTARTTSTTAVHPRHDTNVIGIVLVILPSA